MNRRLLIVLSVLLCTLVLGGTGSCAERGEDDAPELGGGGDAEVGTPGASGAEDGDSFTLRVRVAGLVAMVPNTRGNSLGLLMVDAGTEQAASNDCMIPAHRPTLEWEAGDCEARSTEESDPCLGSSHALAHQDLQLRIVGQGASSGEPDLDLGALADPSDKPADSAPRYDSDGPRPDHLPAEWVVRLGELYPEGQAPVVEESCFDEVPGSDCPVVARLRLDHGTVRTCRLAEVGSAERTAVFGFRSLADGSEPVGFQPRTLGAVTDVVWEVQGTALRVAVLPFGESEEAQVVTLGPDDDGEIVLKLLNLPDESEPGMDQDGPCDATKTDFHFESLYALAAESPDRLYVPYQVGDAGNVQPACALVEAEEPEGAGGETSEKEMKAYPGNITACANGGYSASDGVDRLLATGFGE